MEGRGRLFWKRLLGACPCRGVEWALGYLRERRALFSLFPVSCSGSEQVGAAGGCLLQLGALSYPVSCGVCPLPLINQAYTGRCCSVRPSSWSLEPRPSPGSHTQLLSSGQSWSPSGF